MDTTIYSDGRGGEHEAIEVSWTTVLAVLGRPHAGSPEDDATLVAWLLREGAPAWVSEAEGWIDESCWGLIGPAIETAA